jgi:ribosome-associated protein
MTDADNTKKEVGANRPNKTKLKRESETLQKIGEELLSLKQEELNTMELPDELKDAILTAKKINSRSGLKRQRQYIGKIIRKLDSSTIETQLELIKHKHDTNTQNFKRIEKWRDRLLENDKTALTEIIQHYPDVDRQHINQLIRSAVYEQEQEKPPAASRKLFKYLRDLAE